MGFRYRYIVCGSSFFGPFSCFIGLPFVVVLATCGLPARWSLIPFPWPCCTFSWLDFLGRILRNSWLRAPLVCFVGLSLAILSVAWTCCWRPFLPPSMWPFSQASLFSFFRLVSLWFSFTSFPPVVAALYAHGSVLLVLFGVFLFLLVDVGLLVLGSLVFSSLCCWLLLFVLVLPSVMNPTKPFN